MVIDSGANFNKTFNIAKSKGQDAIFSKQKFYWTLSYSPSNVEYLLACYVSASVSSILDLGSTESRRISALFNAHIALGCWSHDEGMSLILFSI